MNTTITTGTTLVAEHVRGPWPAISAVTVSEVRQSGRFAVKEYPGYVFYALNNWKDTLQGRPIGHRSGITPTRVRLPANGELDALKGADMTAPEPSTKNPTRTKRTKTQPAAPIPVHDLWPFAAGDFVQVQVDGNAFSGVVEADHQGGAATAELAESLKAEGQPGEVLPETPSLFPEIVPGTLGTVIVPLAQTAESACNVRTHYDPARTAELAESLKAEGQLENCVGRWTKGGLVEIVAGGTRRRAQLLRQEQGEEGLALLVNIRELGDAQALRISATENMRRANLTPLEECDAMLRMHKAGDSIHDLMVTFGYKTEQPVRDRIAVAENLHTKGRDEMEAGNLSFAQACVIVRAPGKTMQESMIKSATNNWRPASAADLAKQLTDGQFLVSTANST